MSAAKHIGWRSWRGGAGFQPGLGAGLAAVLLFVGAAAIGGDLAQVTVFQAGAAGYHTFRIPAIVRATNGVLLAFAEGRKHSANDLGNIDVVLHRSLDNGRSWGTLQVVESDGTNACVNPAPVVDAKTGRVILLTTRFTGAVTEWQVRNGKVQDGHVFVQESADNGANWSGPRDITQVAKQPNWRWYATGPVHGIQLTRSTNAGRLIVPCDHSTTNSGVDSALGCHLLYSDDHGTNWRIGASADPGDGIINPNESSAAELGDGRICVATRNQNGHSTGNRAIAYSSDGGLTFDAPFSTEPHLVSPVVQGSLLSFSPERPGGGPGRVLLSAPGDPARRLDLTVRSSLDDTRTWTGAKVIYRGPSAYSDLVQLPAEQIGLLYEAGASGPYERITFATFDTAFLDSP